jgi:hypothetical protein
MVRGMDTLIIEIPAIVKARTDSGGRRLVEVEASNETVDSEGDIILQSALIDAAPQFIKTGNLDIDHISEIGHRYGIANPSAYIVGRPTEVKDIGGGRTSVVGEIMRSRDGTHNPAANKYDEFWDSLMSDPPVNWRASIYGFPSPDGLVDCTKARAGEKTYGATRFLVKGLSWRSLAFTRNPVNDAITGSARVLTQKAFFEVMKSRFDKSYDVTGMPMPPNFPMTTPAQGPVPAVQLSGDSSFVADAPLLTPRNRVELMGHLYGHIRRGDCPFANPESGASVFTFRQHFMGCCGQPEYSADILALALMQLTKHEKRSS